MRGRSTQMPATSASPQLASGGRRHIWSGAQTAVPSAPQGVGGGGPASDGPASGAPASAGVRCGVVGGPSRLACEGQPAASSAATDAIERRRTMRSAPAGSVFEPDGPVKG